jgi:hypothetical protein
MAAKRPTGELPKRNSKLAQFITSSKSNKMTPAQARAAAGKYRDSVKASGATSSDATGAALGKAIKRVKKASTKATPKPTAKPKKPLTASEKAFLAGQKKKAKITKKTGVYPNTAN